MSDSELPVATLPTGSLDGPSKEAAGDGHQVSEAQLKQMIDERLSQLKEEYEHPDEDQDSSKVTKAFQNILHDATLSKPDLEEKLKQLFTTQVRKKEKNRQKLRANFDRYKKLKSKYEAAATEASRSQSTISKLQDLCRLLQRQNKTVTEEHKQLQETEKKRLELTERISQEFENMSTKMQQQQQESLELVKQNQELRDTLQSWLKKIQLQEEHVQKQLEMKDLELKLANAKLEQSEALLQESRLKAQDAEHRLQATTQVEKGLRAELEDYSAKFQGINETIEKSKKLFDTFKTEKEEMLNSIRKLHKEKESLMRRYNQQTSQKAHLNQENTSIKQELESTTRKLAALQNLCRTLQKDRDQYLAGTKEQPEATDTGDSTSTTDDQSTSGEVNHKAEHESSIVLHNSEEKKTSTSSEETVASADSETSESHNIITATPA